MTPDFDPSVDPLSCKSTRCPRLPSKSNMPILPLPSVMACDPPTVIRPLYPTSAGTWVPNGTKKSWLLVATPAGALRERRPDPVAAGAVVARLVAVAEVTAVLLRLNRR